MPITPTAKIWMDGELVDWDKATIHVLTHSLHYGTAVFEGIRAYPTAKGPAVFRLKEHITRLFRSAHILALEVPYSEVELCRAVRDTIRASGLDGCYIRPLVYLGYGEMGLNPLLSKVNVSVAVWPWGAYLGEDGAANGIRLKVSSWARHDSRSMPTAAKATGMYISEGTGENLFLVRDGVIIATPNSAVGALEGITASAVRKIAEHLGYPVREELTRRPDLYLADEAFLSGTAAEIVPVASVDDREVGSGKPGPVTQAIQQVFHEAVRGERDEYSDWLDYVG
jgi:branched-chain amino acid aminotransferase